MATIAHGIENFFFLFQFFSFNSCFLILFFFLLHSALRTPHFRNSPNLKFLLLELMEYGLFRPNIHRMWDAQSPLIGPCVKQ